MSYQQFQPKNARINESLFTTASLYNYAKPLPQKSRLHTSSNELQTRSTVPPKQALATARSVPTLGQQCLHQPVMKSLSLMTSSESVTSSMGSVEEPGSVWEYPDVGSVLGESLSDLEVIRKNLEVVENVLSGQESLKDDFVVSPIVDVKKGKDIKTDEKSKKDKSKKEKLIDEQSYKSGSDSTSPEDPNSTTKRGLFKWGSVNRPKKMPENETEQQKESQEFRVHFKGEGENFKGKFIGFVSVAQQGGDQMCQDALQEMKQRLKSSGTHKPKILLEITIDGIKIKEEKSGDCLYHHPVTKICYIVQDHSENRAFGYVISTGQQDGFQFFGIKTEKPSAQILFALKDLFQVVSNIRKSQMEELSDSIKKTNETHPTLTTTETFDWNLLDVSEETKSLQNSSSNLQQNDIFDPDFDFPNFFVTESTLQQSNIVFPNQPSPPLFQSNFRHHQYSIDPPQSRTISQSPVLTRSPLFQSQISMTEIPNKYSVFEDLDRQLRETKTNISNANLAKTEDGSATSKVILDSTMQPATVVSSDIKRPNWTSQKSEIKLIDSFADLDPLGSGRSRPYIDPKDFFSDLRKPPAPKLSALVNGNQV